MGPGENQCCLAWQLPHCCSVPKSCWFFATRDVLNLWCVDITSGSSAFHYLLEFAQIHVHCVGDAIQPSHPLSSPSPPALNLSQHQGLFQWVSSSYQVAKVLELQFQHQSFHWIFRIDSLRTDLLAVQGTLKSLLQHHNLKASVLKKKKRKHQFFSAQLLYGPNLTSAHGYWKNHTFDSTDICWQSDDSAF